MAANPGLSNRQQMNAPIQPDATLRSTPETVLWGYIAANLAPALTIQSGQTVEIEALSHQGLTTAKDPEKFFAAYGIPNNEVLADAKKIFVEAVDRKSTRLNSSHSQISYAVFCLKKKRSATTTRSARDTPPG